MYSKKNQNVDFNKRILHPEFDVATRCLHEIMDEVMADVAFDVHWSQKTGITRSLNNSFDTNTSKAGHNSNPQVLCPVCQQKVAGARFASHLEKCLNGGKRISGKRSRGSGDNQRGSCSSGNSDGIMSAEESKGGGGNRASSRASSGSSKPSRRKYVYGSMVVRIRFKDGVPVPNSKRETVSYSTFLLRQRAREARESAAAAETGGDYRMEESNSDRDNSTEGKNSKQSNNAERALDN